MLLKDVEYNKNNGFWTAQIYDFDSGDDETIVSLEDECKTKKECKKLVDHWIWIYNGCPCQ